MINIGYTPGCPGCRAAANDLKHRPHTAECRIRLEKAMLEDEMGSNRIKEAKAREDAFLEQQIRIADEASRPMIPTRQAEPEGATPPTPVAGEPRIREAPMPENPSEPRIRDPPNMTWEQITEENDFHDVVNNDAEMYDAIGNIPSDSDNMADQMMSIVQNHMSEVWSVPRVTNLVHKFGLNAGFAYDLLTHDETGKP